MQNTFNPQYNNYGGQNFTFGVPKPQAANTQPLTADVVNMLRQDASNLDLKIDQMDIYRAICTHKEPGTGQSTLVQNNDGTYTCSICGETFNWFEGNEADVDAAVKTILDMFQTCKTIYLDAPNKMTEQYYQMICLLKKFVTVWKHACRNFDKYQNVNNPLNPISSQYGGFNALNTLLTNPWMAQQAMMQGQPQMGYQNGMMPQMAPQMGYQNGMMPQMAPQMGYQNGMMPQMAPQMGYQQGQMMQNPMAYGAPANVPAAPTAPAPGVVPDAHTGAAAASAGEIQQQKTFNV